MYMTYNEFNYIKHNSKESKNSLLLIIKVVRELLLKCILFMRSYINTLHTLNNHG